MLSSSSASSPSVSSASTPSPSVSYVSAPSPPSWRIQTIPAFCITLERRLDRWKRFQTQPGVAELPLRRFLGVDGKTLDVDTEERITTMTRRNIKTKTRRSHEELNSIGGVGCALSHIAVWQWMVDNKQPLCLVFEDDAIVPPDFVERANQVIQTTLLHDPKAWDVWLLGGTWDDIGLVPPSPQGGDVRSIGLVPPSPQGGDVRSTGLVPPSPQGGDVRSTGLVPPSPQGGDVRSTGLTPSTAIPNESSNGMYRIGSFVLFHAYVMTLPTAERLVRDAYPIHAHIDLWTSVYCYLNDLRVVGSPSLRLAQNPKTKTDIQTESDCALCDIPATFQDTHRLITHVEHYTSRAAHIALIGLLAYLFLSRR
jgi:GR25 family glycosyltransferase involved in LPS biosynthesis